MCSTLLVYLLFILISVKDNYTFTAQSRTQGKSSSQTSFPSSQSGTEYFGLRRFESTLVHPQPTPFASSQKKPAWKRAQLVGNTGKSAWIVPIKKP